MRPSSSAPFSDDRFTSRERRLVGLAVAVLLTVSGFLSAQGPRFDHVDRLSVEDGLSHSTVFAIHQDARGFLWFATQDGLNRYDGYQIKVYKSDPEDPHSLSSNDVMWFHEDRQGEFWIVTRTGIERFDAKTESFVSYPFGGNGETSLAGEWIYSLTEDAAGNIWIGTDQGLHQFRPGDAAGVHYRHDPSDPHSLSHDEVYLIFEREKGGLWIATKAGLDRFDPTAGRRVGHYQHDPTEPGSLSHNEIYVMLEDEDGALWVGTMEGLNKFDPSTESFAHYQYAPSDPRDLGRDIVFDIHQDQRGEMWILGPNGLSRLDRQSGHFVRHHQYRDGSGSFADNEITDFLVDRNEEMWLATETDGLLRFDRASGTFARYQNEPHNPHSLSNNSINDLHEDATGLLWIATYDGVNKFDRRREQFVNYGSGPGTQGNLSSDNIWAVHEDRSGMLWVGTYDRGLNKLDRTRGTVVHYEPEPGNSDSLSSSVVSAVLEDLSGELWVGTWGGLDRLDRQNDRFVHYRHDPDDPESLSGNQVLSLLEDRSGTLWIGTEAGLDRFDQHHFIHYRSDPDNPNSLVPDAIVALLEDRSGTLWAGSDSGGLSRFDQHRESFVNYRHDPADPTSLSSNDIATLHEDRSGVLWIGTYGGGLNRLSTTVHEQAEIRHYRQEDGLPSDSVLGILADDLGHLWLSTYKGLSRFDPIAETFRNYNVADGLRGNVFSSRSCFRGSNGEMLFGGVKGLSAFFPDQLEDDSPPPAVALTDFQLFYESASLKRIDSNSPLEESITTLRELILDHRQYVVSFEFAALHFASPANNRYAYMLENFDQDWIETDASRRFAPYSNLGAGEYVFRVRGGNKDGVWSEREASLRLVVLPPPWKTGWAYALYALTLAAAALAYVRWQQRKVERERAISARLRQVDRLKDGFLANTSHELRTPLYGMTGIAESLIDGAQGELRESVKANLGMIVSSGRRLSGLVNDILDFSKLSRKSLELVKRPVDLRALTEVVLVLSRPLVGAKKLELINAVDAALPPADGDENRLHQVLLNLVGNAVKFTEEGSVEVSAVSEADLLTVRVTDTGIGIAEDQHERIFEAFEQADASAEREYGGTGLGLGLTKQLVSLHGGTLWVESRLGAGSTFSFTLPISTEEMAETVLTEGVLGEEVLAAEALAAETLVEEAPLQKVHSDELPEELVREAISGGYEAPDHDTFRLLIVDDEPVIRQVLTNHLSSRDYQLISASGGAEALRLLEEREVDLVLLDIMMPKMSGYEVCRKIREKRSMRELPVIFLSAKNQISDLMTGFAAGANDYLTKPISRNELLARAETHLELLHAHRHLERLVEEKTAQVKVLRKLVPICSICRKVRDDQGFWSQLEDYVGVHSETQFSHGLCLDCAHEHYGELDLGIEQPSR